MFVPAESSLTPYVYHRFTIKEAMDISITTEDFLNNITLYDSAHHIVRRVVKDDYLTSLDVFGYLRGPIFCNRRGSGTIYINVKGKKSAVKWSDTKNYISTIKATTNTLFHRICKIHCMPLMK